MSQHLTSRARIGIGAGIAVVVLGAAGVGIALGVAGDGDPDAGPVAGQHAVLGTSPTGPDTDGDTGDGG